MPEFVFTMQDLRKTVPPDREVLGGISLSFYRGAKIGVVGANGSGKSTLLRIMAGVDTEFQGVAEPAAGVTRGWLPQDPRLEPGRTVGEVIDEGVATTRELLERFNAVSDRFAEPLEPDEMERLLDEQARLQDAIDAAGGWEIDHAVEMAMEALRCPSRDTPVDDLSGGERRRVVLCRLLLMKPDLLLLDEPTNHLDAESVAWLQHHLAEYPGTVVIVTHDRYFLDEVTRWVLELEHGRGIPWEGNYSSWLEQKARTLAERDQRAARRRKTLERELAWIRSTPADRRRKARKRLEQYERLVAEGGEAERPDTEIAIPPGPRLGDVVVEAEGLRKGYADRLLIDGLDFRVPPGAIVGVVGPNGAGKTTLFRMIAGQEEPDGGVLRLGETVRLAHVDQLREALADPDRTVYDVVSGGEEHFRIGRREIRARAWLAGFGFTGADQQKRVGVLSGGERNRVHLALILRAGANVLLLDEPTNDLDVHTLRALEEGLANFGGSVLAISHDRWFLDRVATHVLAFEGDSRVVWFDGGYREYEADRRRRLGARAERPHRIRYRKFSRA